MEGIRSRSEAKRIVTKKIKEITHLMEDDKNVELVEKAIIDLKVEFGFFKSTHEAFCNKLRDEEAIEEAGQGRIHTGFHRFTEGGQKHEKGDFEGSKSKKFPGEHAPGTPRNFFVVLETGHYFILDSPLQGFPMN